MSPDKFSKLSDLPDGVKLTDRQAERLGKLTGVDSGELRGLTFATIADKFRHIIPPELLLFRRICGRVVKRDPVTGIDYPVPFATVHVEDTDCSFFGLFPVESPWAWFFPISCRREELATVVTDACGEFCAWIPRFDIDWIVRWRIERFCYPDVFYKPSLRDILEQVNVLPKREPPIIRPPHPEPDPGPDILRDLHQLLPVERLLGNRVVAKLNVLANQGKFGEPNTDLTDLLDEPAFLVPPAPPLHEKLLDLQERFQREGAPAIAGGLRIAPAQLAQIDLNHYVGPFPRWRCKTLFFPEVTPILDVPDITFRVTQDVDGDGTEETIYGESFFDVRWNAGAIPNVTLHASSSAIATLACGNLQPIGCKELGVQVVGEYQLANPAPPPYYDPATGYAQRPDRPHADGVDRASNPASPAFDGPATAPFGGMLLLRGCNQVQGAALYRIKYSLNGGSFVPFLGLEWNNYPPLGGLHTHFAPVDPANGWYSIDPNPTNWMIPNVLLAWPSYLYANGKYDIIVELADAAKNVLLATPPIALKVDNSIPNVPAKSLEWKHAFEGETEWKSLSLNCPVVRRLQGKAIDFRVRWQVSATHLLVAGLGARGCGSPSAVLMPIGPTTPDDLAHWHRNQFDNSVSRTAIFQLNYAADDQGAYTFLISGYSRAFHPDEHSGFVQDWEYDSKRFGGVLDWIQVAVVDA